MNQHKVADESNLVDTQNGGGCIGRKANAKVLKKKQQTNKHTQRKRKGGREKKREGDGEREREKYDDV